MARTLKSGFSTFIPIFAALIGASVMSLSSDSAPESADTSPSAAMSTVPTPTGGPCAGAGWSSPAAATSAWDAFAAKTSYPAWRFGDAGFSAMHPVSGARIFTFGDSLLKTGATTHKMVNSTAVLSRGAGLELASGSLSWIPPDGDHYFWPGPMLTVGSKLYVMATEVAPVPGQPPGWGFTEIGKVIAVFDWAPCGNPVFDDFHRLEKVDSVNWGASIVASGAFVHVFGTTREGPYGSAVHVATVHQKDLLIQDRWSYHSGPVIPESMGIESGFSAHLHLGKIKLVSKLHGPFGSTVIKYASPTATGEYADLPLMQASWTPEATSYLAKAHYDLPLTSTGKVLVSVSHGKEGTSFDDWYDHPEWYRNTWHEVTP